MSESFIIASSKHWNYEIYSQEKSKLRGSWFYVSTNDELQNLLNIIRPNYIFFLHWNDFVNNSITSNFECVCFHMTDLPYGRGGSPLQNLILNGHNKTTLTAIKMVDKMDAGPYYYKKPLSLEGNALDIYKRCSRLSFEIIKLIIKNDPTPVPQVGQTVIFKRRCKKDSEIPVYDNLNNIYDFIRMLDAPTYPCAYLEHGSFKIGISDAKLHKDKITAQIQITKIPNNE